MATNARYCGSELELFAAADKWKQYICRQLSPFITGRILEVGAGIGATTRTLRRPDHQAWTCLEPDPELAMQIVPAQARDPRQFDGGVEVVIGTISDVPDSTEFDTILYIDVLEHIADDGAEIRAAARRLARSGHLIVLGPAHQSLYCEFDSAIGHFRRYSKQTLCRLEADGLALQQVRYLDSIGLFASLANRTILRSRLPSARQIAFWNGVLVPVSTLIDPITRYRFGKTIYAVWKKSD